MAKLVYAPDSKSGDENHTGSSPVVSTKKFFRIKKKVLDKEDKMG